MTSHNADATFTTRQAGRAREFRDLHVAGRPLLLPNAWDAVSARIVEEAGAPAVATTSAGVAWSLGVPDGDRLGRGPAVELIARVAATVGVPVTADVESGFADTADGVEETIGAVLAAGAVGVNIEDAHHGGPEPLRPVRDQADRIAAARRAADAVGIPLFVNARTDTYLLSVGDPAGRVAETLRRAAAYLAAGADGIFVPGLTDLAVLSSLVEELQAPLNVLAGPGAPGVAALAGVGVARISLGSSVAAAAYAVAQRAARELFADGTYTTLDGALGYGEINALFTGRD
ncbi:isocitrate lyase/phosphoenolpyruvate mutase family protein [Microbispora sp. RL4-1S]|uniref:Isocitrate lyase/phosphoenolpyruvate mutase family protein n=1 Tax=Microbispora oryzae TaxID=2806554 RepID=A0A940WJF3_9ACTN|nr:isocitrate lyase/phosphoenolpyruvate mutase family protein [Microbispora oryzae]MBP2706636.1 isocitrate lyase/phosphoenolpyruvate mutase family protein [Microbispora oryzae]